MKKPNELALQVRTNKGKSASRRLRRLENKVPAIIYGGGKDPISLEVEHNILSKALENESFYSQILTIAIGGEKEMAVLRDLQRHPSKPRILHMDLLRVVATEKINIRIPFRFKGGEDAPGVKDEGGIISHLENDAEVICLPSDLPEFIEVDVSALKLGDSVQLSQLTLPKGVDFAEISHGHENDLTVAAVHIPRAALEEEPTEEVEAGEVPTVGGEAAEGEEGKEAGESKESGESKDSKESKESKESKK